MIQVIWVPVALGLALVAVAAIARLGGDRPRRRIRLSAVLYLVYLVFAVSSFLATALEWTVVASTLSAATALLPAVIAINLAAVVLFDGLFSVLKVAFPDIVHDLTVGAAYLITFGWLLHRGGVNVSSLLTTSAVLTAVIGLSLQATLVNVVGGLALQFDESIREGDWVELDGKFRGQVKKIRWRHTVIETRDWDTLVVPNGALLSQTIKVWGRKEGAPTQHRMWVYFNVDFRYPPGDVIRAVNEALQSAPITNVAADPKPQCICYDLAAEHRNSFAYYAVRYFLLDFAADDPTSSAVRERIYVGLRRAQIPLAVPGATMFVSQDDSEHALRKREKELLSRRAALRSVVLFARLSEEENCRLADTARFVPFGAGEVMTRQGAEAHWLYVMTRGQAEVRVAHPDGSERKVAELYAPTFFGEMALMTGAPREATVVALSEVDCLRVDKDDFREVLTRRPEIAQEISTVLAQRRVELRAVRDNLDADSKRSAIVSERGRLLESIREFFGLNEVS